MNCCRKEDFGNVNKKINKAATLIPILDDVRGSHAEDFIAWVAVDDDAEIFEERTSE